MMLKLISFLLPTLFLAASALAAPKVGDSASFVGKLVGRSSESVVTSETLTAFDAATQKFTDIESQTYGSQPAEIDSIPVSAADVMSVDVAAQIVEACESEAIGVKVNLTVPAGTFATCKIAARDGSTLWVAAVPFGRVKQVGPIADGANTGTLTLTAKSFTIGK